MWKMQFSKILKYVSKLYTIDFSVFCMQYHVSESAVRYWLNGRNFPSNIDDLMDYVSENVFRHSTVILDKQLYTYLQERHPNLSEYTAEKCNDMGEFVTSLLRVCYINGKTKAVSNTKSKIFVPSKGKIQAVVFDFDGTLAESKFSQTTWEAIWSGLGYDVNECRKMHNRFNNKEITHTEWCKLTEEKFIAKSLHRSLLEESIAKRIKLIKGIRATFDFLRDNDIKIYIVSGSILSIIQRVLGSLYQYVDGIKANIMRFDNGGSLIQIVGTKYDFEGKSTFIQEIAAELEVSTEDILFVGNSVNDQFAYQSGARTLCINPKLTDISNFKVWNYNIVKCDDLTEILQYIEV